MVLRLLQKEHLKATRSISHSGVGGKICKGVDFIIWAAIKTPGSLLYIGDYTTQLCTVGIIVSHFKDPD